MGYYFDDRQSAKWLTGSEPEKIIRLMAAKYMGDNPVSPYVWRTWNSAGIQSNVKGGYEFDFEKRFPVGSNGEIAYALGDLFCPAAKGSNFLVSCFGPVSIWLNGEKIFVSNGNQERDGQPVRFGVKLNEGYNRFLICCERTSIGFGCVLQNAMPQWEPCNYVLPFDERAGEAGFLYTEPSHSEIENIEACFGASEAATGINWLPAANAPIKDEGCFYAWADCKAEKEINPGVFAVVDGKKALTVPAGKHSVLLYGTLAEIRKAFKAEGLKTASPIAAHGRCTSYLVLGPCAQAEDAAALMQGGVIYEDTTWRPDEENMLLRPYVEVNLFGRWTYPLGVTLYGLLSSGRQLDEPAFTEYVHQHVSQVTGIQKYAMWDKQHFGFPGVNQQLCWLDALDDCGSFASLMLEEDGAKTPAVRDIASWVANYMINEQPKTEGGAFCRRDATIWADDMYMSVPFLCRYAVMFDSSEAMDLCANELLKYRELLFMPEQKIMAHMICLRHGRNNRIPWCRGNGWVIFSLSELLSRLPENHEKRAALVSFFNELTEGYIAIQGPEGLWHQILDDDTTYPESSSTAMMICAFCRGIRMGLYSEELAAKAAASVKKAWTGLTECVIDRHGNLYGVCQGSGFSFSRAYYRTLMWRFNDTHGIGIVMLAGTELMKTELPE